MYTIFLTASDISNPALEKHLYVVCSLLGVDGCDLVPRWIEKDRAISSLLPNFSFKNLESEKASFFSKIEQVEKKLAPYKIDFFLLNEAELCPKKLLICDMDSTIVDGETLDNLAANVGLQKEVASITARAMAGEFDFTESLQKRIALLQGIPQKAVVKECHQLRYNSGAHRLIQQMQKAGLICILVSGGFTCFTEVVAKELAFHHHHGNSLEFLDGKATGKMVIPVLDSRAKLDFLHYYKNKYNIEQQEILAVGDGANDLPMLMAAGLGIGFHPKNILKENILNSVRYGGLDTILYLLTSAED